MIQALPYPPGAPSPLGRQMGHRQEGVGSDGTRLPGTRGPGRNAMGAVSGRDAGKCGERNTNEQDRGTWCRDDEWKEGGQEDVELKRQVWWEKGL